MGKGTTRIDISTKQAGILTQEEMMKQIETWNFSLLDKQGYWLYPSDFKNIEVTVIFKMLEAEKRESTVFLSLVLFSMTAKEKKKLKNILMLFVVVRGSTQ